MIIEDRLFACLSGQSAGPQGGGLWTPLGRKSNRPASYAHLIWLRQASSHLQNVSCVMCREVLWKVEVCSDKRADSKRFVNLMAWWMTDYMCYLEIPHDDPSLLLIGRDWWPGVDWAVTLVTVQHGGYEWLRDNKMMTTISLLRVKYSHT